MQLTQSRLQRATAIRDRRVCVARPSTARSVRASASTSEVTGTVLTFQGPFAAVQTELAVVEKNTASTESFARTNFHPECEAALNEQVNVEYNVSYVYHAMWAFFNRDNVALPGMAAFFKAGSLEEREHAEMLMEYQNKRGGRVQLKSILMPEVEFGHAEKGDALYAMELALSLEKLNFQKLRELHAVADKHSDANMCDFVEGDLLEEQVEAVKKVSEYVAQLRRVGKGLGVYEFDKKLLAEFGAAA